MKRINKIFRSIYIYTLINLFLLSGHNNISFAQVSADFSSGGGGSIIVGEDTDICDGSKEGAVRYNVASNIVQICNDKLGSYQWTNWGE